MNRARVTAMLLTTMLVAALTGAEAGLLAEAGFA
jgi:hypothetical protein